ncbi:MAG: hypothetical protein MJY50_00510 [Bacteroidales bacterium]|nr:hypothetical protein [Bacteroidales bacterium]
MSSIAYSVESRKYNENQHKSEQVCHYFGFFGPRTIAGRDADGWFVVPGNCPSGRDEKRPSGHCPLTIARVGRNWFTGDVRLSVQ